MDLQTIFARLKAIGENFTAGQIVSLVVSFVLVVGVVGGSAWWLNTPNYALLFADMDEDAAGQVVTRLKSMKVPYSLDEGGRAIRVPATRVDELRLDLTAQGLPSSGRVGFEIFDRTAFGATEFLEKVNYRRALEGEIARTISTIAEVGGARVHIAMGKDSLFGEPRPAKASVVLKLRDSRGLPPSAIAGISNLVAASVEGLRPDAVVILDSMGRPLSQPTEGGDEPGGAAQMERQQRLEHDMQTRLVALLEPVVGDGRVRVNVALKLNPALARAHRRTLGSEHRHSQPADVRGRGEHGRLGDELRDAAVAGGRHRRRRRRARQHADPARRRRSRYTNDRHAKQRRVVAQHRDHQLRSQQDHQPHRGTAGRYRAPVGGGADRRQPRDENRDRWQDVGEPRRAHTGRTAEAVCPGLGRGRR